MSHFLLENSKPFCQKSLKCNKIWSFYNVNFSVAAGSRGSKLWPLESLLILLSSYTPCRGVRNLRFSCYLSLNEKIPKLLYEKFKFLSFLTFFIIFLVQTAIIWLFLDAKIINLKYYWKGASKNYVISIISIISYNVIFGRSLPIIF